MIGATGVCQARGRRLAQPVRGISLRDIRLVAPLAKPIAEPGRAEGLPVFRCEVSQVIRGHHIKSVLKLGQDRDFDERPRFLLPDRQSAFADMLSTHPNHVAATRRRVQQQLQGEARRTLVPIA